MRKKIKQLMNKEEGFTLVELLAVIVILGIILAIAIPSIGGVIDRARGEASDAQDELIEDAARMYYLGEEGQTGFEDPVDIQTLIDSDYLDVEESEIDDLTVTISREDANAPAAAD